MGAHTALRATDRARRSRLASCGVLSGAAALVMLGAGAGTALAAPSHDGEQRGTGNVACDAEGGALRSDAVGAGAGPIASGNTGQIGSCNSFLNHNLNDVSINVVSEQCSDTDQTGIVNNDETVPSDVCSNNVPL